MKLLRTAADEEKYSKWAATKPTAWLEAEMVRLKNSGEYFANSAARDRIDLIKAVLLDRKHPELRD